MNITKVKTVAAAIVAGVVVNGAVAEETAELEEASEGGIWGSANVDLMSKYMWRGTIMNDRPCWQPCVSLGYNTEDFGGIYASVWSSMDFTHHVNNFGVGSRRNCGMQELDYYIGYTKSVGDFDFEFGHWFYTYPNDNCEEYNEIFFSVYYNNPVITPGMELWWQYQDNSTYDPGFYFNFIAKHDFTFFDDCLTVTPKASLGFADAEFIRQYVVDWREVGADGSGAQMTDQTISLVVAYTITENLSVGAHVNYTWVPSRVLRTERWMTYGHDGRIATVWGGVTLTLSF